MSTRSICVVLSRATATMLQDPRKGETTRTVSTVGKYLAQGANRKLTQQMQGFRPQAILSADRAHMVESARLIGNVAAGQVFEHRLPELSIPNDEMGEVLRKERGTWPGHIDARHYIDMRPRMKDYLVSIGERGWAKIKEIVIGSDPGEDQFLVVTESILIHMIMYKASNMEFVLDERLAECNGWILDAEVDSDAREINVFVHQRF